MTSLWAKVPAAAVRRVESRWKECMSGVVVSVDTA